MGEWTVPATVVSIVDGDTFHLNLDLGWRITYQARVRIAHVNAPEMSTPEGIAARTWAESVVKPGDSVLLSLEVARQIRTAAGRPRHSVPLQSRVDYGALHCSAPVTPSR
jgi:endonuclease YncB( thermonuclease family)